MIKKVLLGLSLVLACILTINVNGYSYASASANTLISSDMVYEGETLSVDSDVTGDYITITAGNTLTLSEVTIDGTASLNSVVKVESGATLIVDGLNISSGITAVNLIENYGSVVINNLVTSGSKQYDIYNSSDTCTLLDVDLDKIYLSSGYITVNENTHIANVIQVECSETIETMASLIVRGDGIYASYFMDKFEYLGELTFNNTALPGDDTIYPAMFDYVGAIDEVVTDKASVLQDAGLSVGDIILVNKTSVGTTLGEPSFIGKYTTMADYLKTSSGIYEYRSRLYASGKYLVMDNYHMVSDKGNIIIKEYDEENNAIDVGFVDLTVDMEYNEVSSNVRHMSMGVNGYWLFFVDRLATDYEITTSDNILYDGPLYECASHIAILVKHTGTDTNASVTISFTEEVEKHVTVLVKNSTFTYDKTNHFSSVIAYYLDNNEEYELLKVSKEIINAGSYTISVYSDDDKIILDRDEIEVRVETRELAINYTQSSLVYTGSTISVIASPVGVATGDTVEITLDNNEKVNAGTYTVTSTIDNDNYHIKSGDEEYNFVIDRATITKSWTVAPDISAQYSRELILPTISGVDTDIIDIDYDYDAESITKLGEHNVRINLEVKDTTNYYPLATDISVYDRVVKITEREITAYLVRDEFTYTGTTPNIEVAFMNVIGEDEIKFVLGQFSGVVVDDYEISVELDSSDAITSNYVLASGGNVVCLSIIPADVDMSQVSYEDEIVEYTGSLYVPQVLNLPNVVRVEYDYETQVAYKLGEHTFTAYLVLIDQSNYNPLTIDSLSMKLTIIARKIDVSNVSLSGDRVVYDGNVHGLSLTNLPDHVVYDEDNNKRTDAGNYTVTFTLKPESDNYTLVGRDSMTLSAELIIDRANYSLSHLVFADNEITYDGEEHTIELRGTLPTGLSIASIDNYVNVGTHTVKLEFANNNTNYNLPAPLSAKLTIIAKVINISLKQSDFTYNGSAFTVEYKLTGVVPDDEVVVTLINKTNTHAGSYEAIVDGISNSNYALDKSRLPYTIAKANVDLSGVTLQNKEVEYFGDYYSPKITGTLPSEVSCDIVCGKIKNVGTYDVVAKFSVSDDYNKPADMSAVITIIPAPVVVQFSNNLNLMYSGQVQYISVSIIGMVDNEEYSVVYSKEPKEAGKYSCEVILASNTNYTIPGDTICYFEIFTDKRTFTSDDYVLTVSDGMFSVDQTLSVNKIQLSNEVTNTIRGLHEDIVYMDSIKIVAQHSDNAISVSLELRDLDLKDTRGITLYRLLSNGTIEEVKYTLEDNALKFLAEPNSSFIVVKDKVDNSLMYLLIIVLVLLVVVAVFSAVMIFKNHKLKKAKAILSREN